jgi:DNA end-binding protein Ku
MPVTVWKGQLTFGLVSIPIRIIRAARQERIRFTQVYRPEAAVREQARNGLRDEPDEDVSAEDIPAAVGRAESLNAPEHVERVKRQYIAPDSGEAVPMREVLKGYEYEKEHFAVFHPQEMRKFRAETTRDMEILEFVKLEGIDPVFFNASYYVAPDRGGEKPYSLLFEAMRRSAYAAIARFAMHGREQMLTLRPGKRGILMHTLFYQTEIHAEDEFSADASLVTPQEMKMAELLISHLAADFDAAKFKNEHKARIEAAIDARIANGEASSEKATAKKAAPVVDILDALRRSLERKPPAREAAAKKRPKQRKAGA